MCRLPLRIAISAFVLAFVVFAPGRAGAVAKCKFKIVPRTGEIVVTASGVGANPRWGTFSGFNPATEGIALHDEATCCAAGLCGSCHIGAPGTLAERTPPASCQLCVNELTSGTECCGILRGCTPGLRVRDASFPAGDPRFESVEVDAGPTLRFVGVNVQLVDGSGSTVPGAGNGTGNLIIGYNEDTAPPNVRSGTHTLVIGPEHSWTSYVGFVMGNENVLNGPFASVSGGCTNTAYDYCSSVSGGINNIAAGHAASISGGQSNGVLGLAGSVTGGYDNLVVGTQATISGGGGNTAIGAYASITGGSDNTVGIGGAYSTVVGGATNQIDGAFSTLGGGTNNLVSGGFASVAAGNSNTASGPWAWVGGGSGNVASGNMSAVTGGNANTASGMHASVTAGSANMASGQFAGVSGGASNTASGDSSAVSGGQQNVASGSIGSVSGGVLNIAGPTHQNASVGGGSGVQAGGPAGSPDEWHAGAATGYPTFGPPFGPGTY